MWDNLGKASIVTEFFGLFLAITSLVVAFSRGDTTASNVLRIAGIFAIVGGALLWIVWVTLSIHRLSKNDEQTADADDQSESIIWYKSEGRVLMRDLKPWVSKTDTTELKHSDVISMNPNGETVIIQRKTDQVRAILSLKVYKKNWEGPVSQLITADTDVEVAGEWVRQIYCEFRARVEGKPYKINIRLRKKKGQFFRKQNSNIGIREEVVVRHSGWEKYGGLLPPIRADRDCYISLDILPDKGLKGSRNKLYIRDLFVSEIRPQQEEE